VFGCPEGKVCAAGACDPALADCPNGINASKNAIRTEVVRIDLTRIRFVSTLVLLPFCFPESNDNSNSFHVDSAPPPVSVKGIRLINNEAQPVQTL